MADVKNLIWGRGICVPAFALLLAIGCVNDSHAGTVVGWEVGTTQLPNGTTSFTPTTIDPNVASTALTYINGSLTNTNSINSSGAYWGFTGVDTSDTNSTVANLAAAISSNDIISWTITPKSGYAVNLDGLGLLKFYHNAAASGYGATIGWLQWSTNGGTKWNDFVSLQFKHLNSLGTLTNVTSGSATILSTAPATRLTNPISMRLVLGGSKTSDKIWALQNGSSGEDFYISGSVYDAEAIIWNGQAASTTWSNGVLGYFNFPYVNNLTNSVTFGGTGGPVFVGGSVQVQALQLNATNYSFEADSFTSGIDLADINASQGTASTVNAVFSVPLYGNRGLRKLGSGGIILSNAVNRANTYTGTTEVATGGLRITNAATLGATSNPLLLSSDSCRLDLGQTMQTVGTVRVLGGQVTNGSVRGTDFLLSVSNGLNLNFGADIMPAPGASQVKLTLQGTGFLKTTGTNNTYDGGTFIEAQTGTNSIAGGIFYSTNTANSGRYASFGPGVLNVAGGTTNTLVMSKGSENSNVVSGVTNWPVNYREITITTSNGTVLGTPVTKRVNFGRPVELSNAIVLGPGSVLNFSPHGESSLKTYGYSEGGVDKTMTEFQENVQTVSGWISGYGAVSVNNNITNEVIFNNTSNSYTGGTTIRDYVRAHGPVFGSGTIAGKGGGGRLIFAPLAGETSARYTIPNPITVGPTFRLMTLTNDYGSDGIYREGTGDDVKLASVSDEAYDSKLIKDGKGTVTFLSYSNTHYLVISNGEVRYRPTAATNEISGTVEGVASTKLTLASLSNGVLRLTGQRAGPKLKNVKITNSDGVLDTNQVVDGGNVNYNDYSGFFGAIEVTEGVLYVDLTQGLYPTNNVADNSGITDWAATNAANVLLNQNISSTVAQSDGKTWIFPNLESLTIGNGGAVRLANDLSLVVTNHWVEVKNSANGNYYVSHDEGIPSLLAMPGMTASDGATATVHVGNNDIEISGNLGGGGGTRSRWVFGQYVWTTNIGSVYLSRGQGNTHRGVLSVTYQTNPNSAATNKFAVTNSRVVAIELGATVLKFNDDNALGTVTNEVGGVTSVTDPFSLQPEPVETGVLAVASSLSTIQPGASSITLDRMIKLDSGSVLTVDTTTNGRAVTFGREVYGNTINYLTNGATEMGGVSVIGQGSLKLNASNSFVGDVLVNSGASLNLAHAHALGAVEYTNGSGLAFTNRLILKGGTLKLYTSGVQVQGGILTLTADSKVDLGSGSGYGKIRFRVAEDFGTNRLFLINYNNSGQLTFDTALTEAQLANIFVKDGATTYLAAQSPDSVNGGYKISPSTMVATLPPNIRNTYFSVEELQTGLVSALTATQSPDGGPISWDFANANDPAKDVFAISTDGLLTITNNLPFLTTKDFYFYVKATDSYGTSTEQIHVHVGDATAPVITLNGANPLYVLKGTSFSDPGAVVTDNRDAVRTVYGASTVNTAVNGNYTLTYNATDASGNAATPQTRTVTVTDSNSVITLSTNKIGSTPQLLGYNLAHFASGQNAPGWLRYSGVSAVRIFESISTLKPTQPDTNVLSAVITDCRGTDPSNGGPYASYYASLASRADSTDTSENKMNLVDALTYCKANGIQVCLNLTASDNFGNPGTTANQGEIWRFYYMAAYWAAKNYGVQRYQIWNEPDANNPSLSSKGYSTNDYLALMKVASSAIQCAIKDVNTRTSASLTASVRGPVTAGSADSDIASGELGNELITNNLSVLFDTNVDATQIIHLYDYHHYGGSLVSSGAQDFYEQQVALDSFLTGQSSRRVTSTVISEFNTHTAGNFQDPANSYASGTLDNSQEAMQFGLICSYLLTSGVDEMYAFKFGQTLGTGDLVPAKNGMHFVDNSSTYDVGGITLAGEAWRLINKGFGPGKDLITVGGQIPSGLRVLASRDSSAYYFLSVNPSSSEKQLAVNVSGLSETLRRFQIESCSATQFGGVSAHGSILNGGLVTEDGVSFLTQPGYSVALVTIPRNAGTLAYRSLKIAAAADAELQDGTGKNTVKGQSPFVEVRNSSIYSAQRAVGVVRFDLPDYVPTSKIRRAILKLTAKTGTNNSVAVNSGRVHVYGLPNTALTNWTEYDSATKATWANWSTYLEQNVSRATSITKNVVRGMSKTTLTNTNTGSMMLGQMSVAGSNGLADCLIDVTPLLQQQTNGTSFNFLLSRDVRFNGYKLNTAATSDQVDTFDGECFAFVTTEGATNEPSQAPQLILVTEKIAPQILTHPSSTNKFAKSAHTFKVSTAGDGDLEYQWRKNGTNIAEATSSELRLVSLGTNNNGNYSVLVSNGETNLTSSVATLAVTRLSNNALVYGSLVTNKVVSCNLTGSTVRIKLTNIVTSSATSPVSVNIDVADQTYASVSGDELVIKQGGGVEVRLRLSHPGDDQWEPLVEDLDSNVKLTISGTGGGTPTPSITTSGAFTDFSTTYGNSSISQSFSVVGSDLTEGIGLSAPTGFQISMDNLNFVSSLTLGGAGNLSSTTVYVRLAATAAVGSPAGGISLTSAGADPKTVGTGLPVIYPKAITVTANAKTKVVGQLDPALDYLVSGLVNGDFLSGALSRASGETAAAYAILQGSLSASSNYTLTYVGANLTIQSLASNFFGGLSATNLGPDGVSMLLRYAFGGTTNGNVDQALMPSPAISGGNLVLTYYARTNDTNLSVLPQVTTNLGSTSNWGTNGITINSNVATLTTNGTTLQKRTASVPISSNNKQFLRLRVLLQP